MVRMATIIHRYHIRHLNALEDAPHDTLSHYITLSLLFGREAQDAGVCVCVYTHTRTHTHTHARTHTHTSGRKLRSVFSADALAPLQVSFIPLVGLFYFFSRHLLLYLLFIPLPRSVAGLFNSFSRSLLLLE